MILLCWFTGCGPNLSNAEYNSVKIGMADKKHDMAIFLDDLCLQTIWSGFMLYPMH